MGSDAKMRGAGLRLGGADVIGNIKVEHQCTVARARPVPQESLLFTTGKTILSNTGCCATLTLVESRQSIT